MKDYRIGITAPPFYTNCRITTIPCFDDDLERRLDNDIGRMARDPKTGKSLRVENLSYDEWYKKYVNGESEHEHTKSSDKNNVNSVNWDFINSKKFKENI